MVLTAKEKEWGARASRFLKAELKRAGIGYKELAERFRRFRAAAWSPVGVRRGVTRVRSERTLPVFPPCGRASLVDRLKPMTGAERPLSAHNR
jgi:hypothetical protein